MITSLLLALAIPSSAACGLDDAVIRRPAAVKAPAPGGSYVDPAYGCRVRRLTEAGVTHAYSSVNPFNSDSTLVLVEAPGGVLQARDLLGRVVAGDLSKAGVLPASSAFWSRRNRSLLYYHTSEGNELRSHDVRTGETKTLHVFSAYKKVSFGLGEGDLSADGDHLAVVGDGRHGFIHRISTGKSTPPKDLSAYGGFLDHADVTPANRLVLVHDQPGGVELFDKNMGRVGTILDYQGHGDRGRDLDGADMVVMTNSADKTPIPDCQNGIVKTRLPAGPEKCLLPMDWSLAVHVSCNALRKPWCLVSSYVQGGVWKAPGTNELILVNLDGKRALRIAHTRSTGGDYKAIPRAALSGDGRWAVFASDMAGGAPSAYLVELPR